jgi:outer membrane protein assembly factor BamB
MRRCAHARSRAALLLVCSLISSCAPTQPSLASSLPPGAPPEDLQFASEWPSPNGDLYNTRVAHSTISSANVSQLRVAWSVPLQGTGTNGADVANPVMADGIAYLQDGASNVTAVRYATGQVLWTHPYNSPAYGPNGVTIAYGRIYGVTATGVFALVAQTGQQVWYVTDFGPTTAKFNIAPQVAGNQVFVSSSLTAGGGVIYALDAGTGATAWSFQTVIDKVGQQLKATAGGAWDALLIGPDRSVYAGIGNAYLSQQQAQDTPSRQLYTDSLIKLTQATGTLQWYFQAFPNDFHDWDLQISPIYTSAGGRPVVLAAGKGGYVFAIDPTNGTLLWKTAVGTHNGHDDDGQLALDGKLQLQTPYTLYPGEIGGVETNMAAADGVVYVPVVNVPTTYTSATSPLGTPDFTKVTGEMVAIDIASGKQLWDTKAPGAVLLGGATVANDLVFTTTLNGGVAALSRKDGAILWTAQLPGGSNSTLAIAGDTLLAGAGIPRTSTQHGVVVAYQLGAQGSAASPPAATATATPTR